VGLLGALDPRATVVPDLPIVVAECGVEDALAIRRAQGVRLGRPPLLPADVVARIVAARRSGAGWSAIARDLDADGVATAQGGARWYPATVRAVYFANETEAA
jgi:hypothetical protein